MRLPKDKHRGNTGQIGGTPPNVVGGAPWPAEHIQVVHTSAKREVGNRTILLIAGTLFVAWAVFTVWFFVGDHGKDKFNLLWSMTGAILSIVAAGLAYRSSRIATRVERRLSPEVADWERLRAHETESFILIRALEVFGDSDRAIQWLRENNPALRSEPPIRVIHTDDGRREVLNILGRIQHGVIS